MSMLSYVQACNKLDDSSNNMFGLYLRTDQSESKLQEEAEVAQQIRTQLLPLKFFSICCSLISYKLLLYSLGHWVPAFFKV
jgi:hypothetical protein